LCPRRSAVDDDASRFASFVSEPRDQKFSYDATRNLLSKLDYGRVRNEHVWLADRPVR
jgi:hypothetical protein